VRPIAWGAPFQVGSCFVKRLRWAIILAVAMPSVWGTGVAYPHEGSAPDVGALGDGIVTVSDAIELSREYLAAEGDQKGKTASRLATYEGSIAPVISALSVPGERQWNGEHGFLVEQHFTAPRLRDKYAQDLLFFWVPEEYDGTAPYGLLIFMHGGNSRTARTGARVVLEEPGGDRHSYGLRPYIEHAAYITVAPSAPWDKSSDTRWNLREADEYIGAVRQECEYRFRIDRDRVFLGGQSMGGFGAYHLCQRLGDTLAGAILVGGAWAAANWASVIGTPLYISHGANDAVAPGTPGKAHRPRYTDVFYARTLHKLLTQAGAEHVYVEHAGGHALREATQALSGLVDWMATKRRDPFYPRVVAVTPRGWRAWDDTPTPHSRWVSILETGEGEMEYDAVHWTGPDPKWEETREEFDRGGMELTKVKVKGALADARYKGSNVFDVITQNVTRFSLWLHPGMVDFAKPIQITVNGTTQYANARPALLDALRSYERRRDWGLVYYCELAVDVK